MPDFLAQDNPCGQDLLALTGRGTAIITDIQRLSSFIPNVYRLKTKVERDKYCDIIHDFHYFTMMEIVEKKISSNEELQELDNEFQENCVEILTKFLDTFAAIYKYAVDLNGYIEDLERGNYIHQTIEKILLDQDGKQLLVEALYLYGIMLMTVDQTIDGVVRERLLVSSYRYLKGNNVYGNMDKICSLLRATKFKTGQRRPVGYPEDLFQRCPINADFVDMVINRLCYDDIYNMLPYYPLTKHRRL
eukprot:Ihof_evm1s240 gene=Ihof_evmTU1s240